VLLPAPELWEDHFAPPLVVPRTVPDAPAAKHVLVDGQDTPSSCCVLPDDCEDHFEPAFVVASTVPLAPATKQVPEAGHDTAASCLVVPDVWPDQTSANVPDASNSIATTTSTANAIRKTRLRSTQPLL
jgi:hypothetical protein